MVEGFLYHKLLTKFSFLSITPLLEIYKAGISTDQFCNYDMIIIQFSV